MVGVPCAGFGGVGIWAEGDPLWYGTRRELLGFGNLDSWSGLDGCLGNLWGLGMRETIRVVETI